MRKTLVTLFCGLLAGVLLLPGISTAADSFKEVLITNDASRPVPTRAEGTTEVRGAVNVGTTAAERAPYQHSFLFNQSDQTCTQFVCKASFPAVPAGQRLVVTYASARFALTSGGVSANVALSVNGATSPSILLPAPVRIGFDSYVAAGPVSFYVGPGQTPTLELGGQFVLPVSNTAEVSLVGYLVPAA
ncbi:MAG TPA: hypothetical protein VFO65_04780 [Acidimicrobiales bacterium]|nr:hypothetical protein [Acidimicrobiales bacterium]